MPLNFSTGLGPLIYDGAASASILASVNWESFLAINLGGLQSVLTGTGPAPSNGRLSSDVQFLLSVGNQAPVTVSLSAESTQTNTDVDDLVNDLNGALGRAGVGGEVVASESGGVISLTDSNGDTLQLTAVSGSATSVPGLNLPYGTVGPNFAANTYLDKGTQLLVTASASAAGINGSAAVGMLAAGIQGGVLNMSLEAFLTLKGGANVSLESLMDPQNNMSLVTVQPGPANVVGAVPADGDGRPGAQRQSDGNTGDRPVPGQAQ